MGYVCRFQSFFHQFFLMWTMIHRTPFKDETTIRNVYVTEMPWGKKKIYRLKAFVRVKCLFKLNFLVCTITNWFMSCYGRRWVEKLIDIKRQITSKRCYIKMFPIHDWLILQNKIILTFFNLLHALINEILLPSGSTYILTLICLWIIFVILLINWVEPIV